jgi:hypothetical protein
MKLELKEIYDKALNNMNKTERGTELFGYWLGKASAINEIISLK